MAKISNPGVGTDINSAEIADDSIVNADINSSAAIALSKLDITDNITNAMINSSAAIALSKLDITNNITNAMINSSAAIDMSKISVPAGAGLGKAELIQKSENTGTANKTFTLSPSINLDNYAMLKILISGVNSTSAALQMTVDSKTANYRYNYTEDDLGTITNTTASGQAQFVLADTSIFDLARWFTAEIHFMPMEQNEGNALWATTWRVDVADQGRSIGAGFMGAAAENLADLDEITVKMASGGFQIHSRFALIGILK